MRPRDPTEMVGAVIAERFRIVSMLGRGGGGAVFQVEELSTQNPAALKMVLDGDADLAARLDRESTALALVTHPNVVAFIDAGRVDDAPYLVTELIRGISLRDLIEQDAVEPRRALAIVLQLLEALDQVHGVGMIHRDIKPENILLVAGGHPVRSNEDFIKLLDFGAAKDLDQNSAKLGEHKLTRAGLEVIGSPPYIAPETAIGEPLDPRTDLYSVGVVLFELLTGHVPFDHEDRSTLLRMHVTDKPPKLRTAAPARTFTPALEQLVATALAKLPDHRFASAIAMHGAIDAAARALATDVRPAQTAAPGWWTRARRHPRRVAVMAAIAAVAVVVALVVWPRSATKASAVAPRPAANARSLVDEADIELAAHRYDRAITAYEQAIARDQSLARDGKIKSSVAEIASRADGVPAVIALEVLASRVDPPDTQTIAKLAAGAELPDVRRRAVAIAERDGFANAIDRMASWSLDLKQPASCEVHRETIAKLRDLGDKRAIEPLKRSRKQFPCIAKEAEAAIDHLQVR